MPNIDSDNWHLLGKPEAPCCVYAEHGAIDKCSLEGQFSPYSIFMLLSWEEGTFKAHRY